MSHGNLLFEIIKDKRVCVGLIWAFATCLLSNATIILEIVLSTFFNGDDTIQYNTIDKIISNGVFIMTSYALSCAVIIDYFQSNYVPKCRVLYAVTLGGLFFFNLFLVSNIYIFTTYKETKWGILINSSNVIMAGNLSILLTLVSSFWIKVSIYEPNK